jgi:hypothetical protein
METEDTPVTSETPLEGTEETLGEVTDLTDVDFDPEIARAEAKQLLTDAEREEIRNQERENLRHEQAAERERERQAEMVRLRAESLLQSFGETVKEVRTNLKDSYDIDDEDFEKLIAQPLNRFNQSGVQAATLQALSNFRDAALIALPEDQQEAFLQRVHGKPIQEWLVTFAETYAPKSAHSARSKKEQDAAIKAAEARGFNRGRQLAGAPPSSDGAAGGGSQTVDLNSISGIIKAKAAGLMSDDEFNSRWRELRDGSV